MAYSQDWRERVLDLVADGGSKKAAAERFNVGLSTVFLWCKTPEKLAAEKPGPIRMQQAGFRPVTGNAASQAERAYSHSASL